jgi:hypothetical protein
MASLSIALSWGLAPTSSGAEANAEIPTSKTERAGGWRFTVNQVLVYTYECDQAVSWNSTGDKLDYQTTVMWRFILTPTQVAEDRAVLNATILAVRAMHRGPGSQRDVDSSRPATERGDSDPLLGHLLALENAVFTITCDPRTGVVSSVTGGDEVAKRIARKAPSGFQGAASPDEASPLLKPAEKAYSSAALSRLWSQLLAVPADGLRKIPLGPPLLAEVEQLWTGPSWTCTLPKGASAPTATLATDPAPVEVAIAELAGQGKVVEAPVPQDSQGELRYTLRFKALTQPVDQLHILRWRLVREGGAPPR